MQDGDPERGAQPTGASGAAPPRPSGLSPTVNELLDAVIYLGSDLNMSRVLDRIVESACQITSARYGALAVLGADEAVENLVTHGLADEDRERIGALPQAHGLLGELIREVPIRLERIEDHPSAAGLPLQHPLMTTFLGVSVRVRGTVFGYLYLSEKQDGSPFSAGDEETVLALAASAGFVIENARAYAVSERQRRWLEAATRMTETVTSVTPTVDALREIAGNMRAMTAARAVAIVAAEEENLPSLLILDGPDAAALEQLVDERSGAVSQALGGTERHLRVEPTRSLLILPLAAQLTRATAVAVLLDDGEPGIPPDFELIRSFADQAALTLDRAQGVRDRESMAVVSDRERIARDLHDSVIQRLFASGLLVHSAISAPAGSDVEPMDVLTRVGDNLDQTISDIRTTIFELQSSRTTSLRSQVLALAREFVGVLGFTPSVRSHGAVDTVVAGALVDEVLIVLREALSNVARHARASSAWVELMVSPDALSVVIGDDGVGLPAQRRESGLANMVTRAERLGGTCEIASPASGGTVLRWNVPVE